MLANLLAGVHGGFRRRWRTTATTAVVSVIITHWCNKRIERGMESININDARRRTTTTTSNKTTARGFRFRGRKDNPIQGPV